MIPMTQTPKKRQLFRTFTFNQQNEQINNQSVSQKDSQQQHMLSQQQQQQTPYYRQISIQNTLKQSQSPIIDQPEHIKPYHNKKTQHHKLSKHSQQSQIIRNMLNSSQILSSQNNSILGGCDQKNIDCDTKSVDLKNQWHPLTKHQQENLGDGQKNQKHNSSTDGQLKQSLNAKNSKNSKQSNNKQEASMLASIDIDDSFIRGTVASTILAHYKLGSNQQIQKIDNVLQKHSSKRSSISKKKQQRHWKQVTIPQDIFNDDSQLKSSKNSGNKIKVTFAQKNQEHYNYQNNNMNPLQYIPQAIQQGLNFNSFHPQQQQQQFQNQQQQRNQQQQNNNNFLHPSMSVYPNLGNSYHPNFNQMQFSQIVPCVQPPPFSPRTECYWQMSPQSPNAPPQQQYWAPSYSPAPGQEVMHQVRFLREQIRMLRDFLKEQRADKIHSRYRSQNQNRERQHQRKQTQQQSKWQQTCFELKSMLQLQQRQHEKQLKDIELKFGKQISRLQDHQFQLQQQNQDLRRRQAFHKKNIRQQDYMTVDCNGMKSQRVSSRKKSLLQTHPSSQKYNKTDDLIKQKLSTTRRPSSSKNNIQKRKNSQQKTVNNRGQKFLL